MKNRIRLDVLSAVALVVVAFLASNFFVMLGCFFGVFCLTKGRWDEPADEDTLHTAKPSLAQQMRVFALIWLAGLLAGATLFTAYTIFTPGKPQAFYGSAILLLVAGFIISEMSALTTKHARKAWQLDAIVK